MDRRSFNQFIVQSPLFLTLFPFSKWGKVGSNGIKISLAQWSFHRALKGGEMDNFGFIAKAKSMGFEGVEFVSQFFQDKAEDQSFLDALRASTTEHNITPVLIMIDGEGELASENEEERSLAVINHQKWIRAAKHIGCQAIRVNLFGSGSRESQLRQSVKSLIQLGELAEDTGINILVENHGSYSSDGSWIAEVMQSVARLNVGTLPDFGNFCVKREGGVRWGAPCVEEYDIYKGVKEMMPYAKAVSAKSFNFDAEGNEKDIDFQRMLKIVKDYNYKGYIGVEYEGENDSEEEGILKTKQLIERFI